MSTDYAATRSKTLKIPKIRGEQLPEFYGDNLLNQHWREQGIDFGYFGINAYNRPVNFGFALTAKY